MAVVLQRGKYQTKQTGYLNMREQYISVRIAAILSMLTNQFVKRVVMKFEIERLQIQFVSLL